MSTSIIWQTCVLKLLTYEKWRWLLTQFVPLLWIARHCLHRRNISVRLALPLRQQHKTLESLCRINICGSQVLPLRQLDNLSVQGRRVCQKKCLLTAIINPLSRPNSLSGWAQTWTPNILTKGVGFPPTHWPNLGIRKTTFRRKRCRADAETMPFVFSRIKSTYSENKS